MSSQPYHHPMHSMAPVLAPGTQPPIPEPMPRAITENGRRYELHVIQQPKRARMCGFGDKDRRPITPPPCVKLVITDINTGKEVDCNEIDHGMFVLNVDLWNEEGTREVNLVRHSAASPSISTGIPVSWSTAQEAQLGYPIHEGPQPGGLVVGPYPGGSAQGQQAPYNPYPGPPQVTPYTQSQLDQPPFSGEHYQAGYAPTTNGGSYQQPQNGYQSQQQQQRQQQQQQQQQPQQVYYTGAGIHQAGQQQQQSHHQQQPAGITTTQIYESLRPPPGPGAGGHNTSVNQPTGMFTRNLIGSLAASAFRLTDPDDRIGIWFILQDLSVRTEGRFRLRFSFVNVGVPPVLSPVSSSSISSNSNATLINTGRAPVLAACFSEVFTVYSAKKFPGVVESTHLSKCFATQGIKIPIRKDGPGGKGDKSGNRDEYDED